MAVGAVFFDVDGTLVPGTSSSQHLASFLGHGTELRAAEADYAAGRLSNQQVSVLDAEAWAGCTPEQVDGWLTGLPLVDGIAEVVQWCHEHDLVAPLATLAWEPVGRHLVARYGFDGASGPALEVRHGSYTGEVARHLDEDGKRDHALAVAARHHLPAQRCAAVGDSRSDLPLFAAVGLSIAFNGSAGLRAVASTSIDGDDLRDVLPALAAWVTDTGGVLPPGD